MRIPITLSAASATAGAAVLLLTSCAGAPADDASAAPQPTATVTETATPEPTEGGPDADVLVRISATATAPSGAALDVTVSLAAALPATSLPQEALDAFASYCPDYANPTRFAEESWSYYPLTVEATDVGDTAWTPDVPLEVVSSTGSQTMPSAVVPTSPDIDKPDDPAGEVGPCLVPGVFGTATDGTVLQAYTVGDDAPGVGTDGTGWGYFRFGVSAEPFISDAPGATLSDCTIELTDLGEQHLPADVTRADTDDGVECSTGREF